MNYFNIPKYFGAEIVFCGLLHFLFADYHVLPDTKLGRRDSNTLSLGLHPTPYSEDVSIVHSRRRRACSLVNRVIVSLDKFRQNVYISVRISDRGKFEKSLSDRPLGTFHDGTFHIGIFENLELNVLIT